MTSSQCRISALVLTACLLATSCTSASEIVAPPDPAVADEGTAQTSAEAPPAADETPADEAAQPDAAPEPELLDGKTAEEHLAAAGVNLGEPATRLIPAPQAVGDVVAMAYDSPVSETTIALDDEHWPIGGFTPDGQSLWAQGPTDLLTCSEGAANTRLSQINVDTGETAPLDAQNDALLDVVRIHHGPGEHVLLEHSCGKYTSPGVLAKMSPDGTLRDIQTYDGLSGQLWMWEPRWGWTEAGDLVVVIPMGAFEQVAIDNYIDVATGEVLESVATEFIGDVVLSNTQRVQITPRVDGGEGHQVLLNGEPVWAGIIGDRAHDHFNFLAVGSSGGVWVQAARPGDEPSITILDRPLSSVAIAPTGEVVALADPDGVELVNESGSQQLADEGGRELAFSSDGSRLSMVTRDSSTTGAPDVRTWEFAAAIAGPEAIVPGTVLSSNGLGPIQVGMTIAEVEEATGRVFDVDSIGPFEAGACFWASTEDLLGVSLMGEAQSADPGDAIVKSVSVWSPMYPTPSGVRVRDTTDKVLGLFPDQIEVSPHTFTNGQYLDFVPQDEGEPNGVRFETATGGQVDAIHAGVIEWTRFVEGCA